MMHRHSRRWRALLPWLLGALLLPGAALPAAANRYRVEVIIFRAATAGGGESWNAAPEGRGFDKGSGGGGTPQVIVRLDADKLQLGGLASRLRGGGYRVLAHAGWIQSASNWPTHAGLSLGELGISAPGLSGQVYVERATLLHLGFDLALDEGSQTWRLKELRRVKFNEKQYFDHPGFGVIALVSPA